jgi:peptidoglycan/xylan/chitin deacetylase (PgdA/CDA1 family)
MAASRLVELGAHTHTHGDFRGQVDRFGADLEECVRSLTLRFGGGPYSFAFPFGRRHLGFVDDAMIERARAIGVTCALTTEAAPVDWASDPFGWGRFNVYEWDTAATIRAKIDGWYGWAPTLQERLAGGTAA